MAKVLVTNIPINAYASAWIEVPDGTPTERLNAAVAESICEGGFILRAADVRGDDAEVDEGEIHDGWEFNIDDTEEDAAKRDLDALSAYADSKRPA